MRYPRGRWRLAVPLILFVFWQVPPGHHSRSFQLTSAEGGGPAISRDYLHPEVFRQPTWIDVTLPSQTVVLKRLRILTGNRAWQLSICESQGDLGSCIYSVPPSGETSPTWKRDYEDSDLNLGYTDLDGGQKLHVLVDPVGGDWMIFRIQLSLEVP